MILMDDSWMTNGCFMWLNHSQKPAMTGSGKHSTQKHADDSGMVRIMIWFYHVLQWFFIGKIWIKMIMKTGGIQ